VTISTMRLPSDWPGDRSPLQRAAAAALVQRRRGERRVLAASLGLLIVTLVLRLMEPLRASGTPHVHWLALSAAFGLAELVVMNVQGRREARSVSLSEAPLVLGLFVCSSSELVLARLIGPLIVFALLRRQPPLKVLFNAAQLLAEVVVAIAVFDAVLGGRPTTDPRAWVAAYCAIALAGTVASCAVALVIALSEESFHWADLRAALRSSATVSAVVGTLALVGINALQRDGRTWWLLLASSVVMLGAYRAYASLTERHQSLELLYGFSAYLNHTRDANEVLRRLLVQTRDLLHAEHAEVVFRPLPGSTTATRLVLDDSEHVVRSEIELDALHRRALSGTALFVPQSCPDTAMRRALRERGFREAICVPLVDDADESLASVVAADRLGRVRSFDEGDVRLLQTVANHAGMALRNSKLIDRLVHAAQHDVLTGLPNRTLLQQRTEQALDEVRDGWLPGLAVLLLDLDGFKDVNDALGHDSGDTLLQVVADRLRGALSPTELAARLGGDEFAVLLPGTCEARPALETAQRLVQVLKEPVDLGGVVVTVGASFGVSLAPAHGLEASRLLKRADLAMYAAKAAAGGVRLFDPNLERPGPGRLTLLAELRRGLAGNEIVVHVQPKVLLATGEVSEVEVLARWRHPRRGLLLPAEFVPLAESAGLMGELTSRVLDVALAACARWRAAGVPIGVAVNVSARSFDDHSLPTILTAGLARHGLPSDVLTLEITESGIMSDPERSLALLGQLHDQGVRLSIDDFGTGYSSLAYLERLPVQQVKIDKGFIRHLGRDEAGATIVRSIIQLGGDLSLEVVAEGVEERDAWDELVRLGCPHAQGFLLAKPMPTEDFLPWLRGYQARIRDAPPAAEPLQLNGAMVLPRG